MLPLECINCSSSWSWRRWIGWEGSWWGGSGERSCHCHLKLSNLQPSQIICQWNMQITCKIPLDKRIFFRYCSSYPPPSPHPPLSHFSLRLLFKRCFNNSALAQPNWQCAGGRSTWNRGKTHTKWNHNKNIYLSINLTRKTWGSRGNSWLSFA